MRTQIPGDLETILDYLASHSPAAADRFGEAVDATLDDLAAMAGKGSPKQYRGPLLAGIRSWPVAGFPNYLVLYRPITDGIEVFLITHGARNIPKLLRDRLKPRP